MCFSLTYVRPQTHPSRSRDPRPSPPPARPRPLRKSNFQLSGAPRPLRGHATRFSGGISQERRRVPLVCGALWRSHWTQFRQVTTRRYSTAHDPKTHNTCTTTRHICARSVHRTPQTLSQLNAQRSARAAVSSENTHGSPTDPLQASPSSYYAGDGGAERRGCCCRACSGGDRPPRSHCTKTTVHTFWPNLFILGAMPMRIASGVTSTYSPSMTYSTASSRVSCSGVEVVDFSSAPAERMFVSAFALMSETLRGTQRHSEPLRATQESIRGTQNAI